MWFKYDTTNCCISTEKPSSTSIRTCSVLSYVSFKDSTAESKNYFIINSEMSDSVMDYQEQAAGIYDVEYIRLESIHKMNGHLTIQGMKQISEQVLAYLDG